MHEIDKKRRMDDTKLPWHLDRIEDKFKNNKRISPIHIDMGIAKFCNIKCSYCFGFFQNPKVKFINKKSLFSTMILAPKIGVKSIALIGDGEPTCNPYLWESLYHGKNSGLDLAISTNGVLLYSNDRILSILENCEWMRFCLSAGTKEGYIVIHGKDYFDIVKRNIENTINLRDKYNLKCEIGLQAVFVPTIMIDEMLKESELAVQLGVDYFVIKQCSLPDSGESGMTYFDINYYDKPEVQETLKKCQDLSNERTEIIPKWNTILQKGIRPYNHCSAVSLISEISGNGDWYPCGYMFGRKPEFEEYRFGNIEENTIEEIYNSERYWKIIEKMEKEFDVHKQCKGSCRLDKCNEWVNKYIENSNIEIPNYTPKGINFI